MGSVAENTADHVVITDDNPRTENSGKIMSEIRAGMQDPNAATCIADRGAAILYAAEHSEDGDIIIVAGKGHESVQIVGEDRLPFDDLEVVRAVFEMEEPG